MVREPWIDVASCSPGCGKSECVWSCICGGEGLVLRVAEGEGSFCLWGPVGRRVGDEPALLFDGSGPPYVG